MKFHEFSTVTSFRCENCLPNEGLWVGRAWLPNPDASHGIAGPHVICVEGGKVFDLSERYLTVADLLASDNAAAAIRIAPRRSLGDVNALLESSLFHLGGDSIEF